MTSRVSKNVTTRLVSRIPLFERCSRRDLDRIGSFMTEVRRGPGTVLTQEGQPGDEFIVIVEGEASISAGGEERARLGPGLRQPCSPARRSRSC